MSYVNTFIRVADDCPTSTAEVPAPRARPSVAELQHGLLSERPYELTEEELYVRVHGARQGLGAREINEQYEALHTEVFAKPQACLRASPLTKRYGYGAHYDAEGRIALHPRDSDTYARLSSDPALKQLPAMRSTRACRAIRRSSSSRPCAPRAAEALTPDTRTYQRPRCPRSGHVFVHKRDRKKPGANVRGRATSGERRSLVGAVV